MALLSEKYWYRTTSFTSLLIFIFMPKITPEVISENIEPIILFEYNGTPIISRVDREDGMVELTSDSGNTYVVFPEEITV